jgi:hypothetical protein
MSFTAPDEKWLPFLKMLFGVLLLVLLATLAAVIGLGKVQQETSFGLQDILGGLLVLSGAYSQWAFGGTASKRDGEGE